MELKGNYSSGTTYSVGDVVRNDDGYWYILQKPCKAGTPPVNTLYWGRADATVALAAELAEDAVDRGKGKIVVDGIISSPSTTTVSGKTVPVYDVEHYCECNNAAATAAKTCSFKHSGNSVRDLAPGTRVTVVFKYTNSATTPTLKVASTGAKGIKYKGTTITTDADAVALLSGVCEFVYDGTNWNLI